MGEIASFRADLILNVTPTSDLTALVDHIGINLVRHALEQSKRYDSFTMIGKTENEVARIVWQEVYRRGPIGPAHSSRYVIHEADLIGACDVIDSVVARIRSGEVLFADEDDERMIFGRN